MILDDIQKIIEERKKNPTPDSYVSNLVSRGKDEILKKIGEESAEVIVASKNGDKEQTVYEIADLWFHCLILMSEEGIDHTDILTELKKRYQIRRR